MYNASPERSGLPGRRHRKTRNGRGGIFNAALVELRLEQGRLDEAERELGTLVADARNQWGAQDLDTLEAEAVAARLKHAQRAAELREWWRG